ncbi:hypothetical protein Tco_0272654 [Tanacetum coccineum]
MSTLKVAETRNLVAFLEKPKESNGFEEIIDFLNRTSDTSPSRQKELVITEKSIRSDLKLDDAEGTNCLPTATIFVELERMGTMASAIICLTTNQNFNFSKYIFDNMVKNLEGGVKFLMYPRFVQVFLDKQVEGMSRHKGIYVLPSHTKKVFANMKRSGKGFSGNVTPLFETMMVQATEDMGEDLAANIDSHSTPIHTQPSSSKPQKKRVLALETTKSNQAVEIERLKRRVKSLEKRRKSRTPRFKRLRKVGLAGRVESYTDVKVAEKEVSDVDPVTIVGEVVTTANVEVTTANAPITTIDELTLAQTLIEIKAAKPKAVTAAATTTTTTRPKAKGVVVQEPSEFKTTSSPLQASQLPQAKDKGKAKMVEPEKPLKKKDQIAMDEEVARNLEAQLQAELEEEERISRLKEEKANIDLLESWDNTQAMMDADFQLAQQMQTEEQEQLSIEEKSKLFVELLEKRKKHFAALRAQEKRSKPPTKAQKRNTMSTYLKNMAGYKHNQLKSKSYDEIQEMFDKEMKRVNTFVDMNTELVKSSKTRIEGSSKRAGDELESDNSKKQKIDEHVEAEKDDDQEEAEMKKHIEIVKDDEVAIDAIPLATKPLVIVKYKIVKEGKFVYFQLIRADGSSKRYLSMIKMLQNIDREDLETLWKLVKAKHGNTRPEDEYERVLWGDMKFWEVLDRSVVIVVRHRRQSGRLGGVVWVAYGGLGVVRADVWDRSVRGCWVVVVVVFGDIWCDAGLLDGDGVMGRFWSVRCGDAGVGGMGGCMVLGSGLLVREVVVVSGVVGWGGGGGGGLGVGWGGFL